jgi:hypothetical protein
VEIKIAAVVVVGDEMIEGEEKETAAAVAVIVAVEEDLTASVVARLRIDLIAVDGTIGEDGTICVEGGTTLGVEDGTDRPVAIGVDPRQEPIGEALLEDTEVDRQVAEETAGAAARALVHHVVIDPEVLLDAMRTAIAAGVVVMMTQEMEVVMVV